MIAIGFGQFPFSSMDFRVGLVVEVERLRRAPGTGFLAVARLNSGFREESIRKYSQTSWLEFQIHIHHWKV